VLLANVGQPLLSRGKGELAQSARLWENSLCVLRPCSAELLGVAASQRPILTETLHRIVTVIMVVFPQAIAIARAAAGVPNASDPRVGTCLVALLLSAVPVLLSDLLSALPVLLSELLSALPVLLSELLSALPVLLSELLSALPVLQLFSTVPFLHSALPVLLLLTTAGHTTAGCRLHALLQENSPYWKDIAVGHGASLQENDEWKSRWRII
jgi:hypothetical protein